MEKTSTILKNFKNGLKIEEFNLETIYLVTKFG